MKNATLPKDIEELEIKDIPDGIHFYTVPWAMYADENGELWLNGNYNADKEKYGTVKMDVIRLFGSYIVNITHCKDYKWNKENPCYAGEYTPIPVSKLVR